MNLFPFELGLFAPVVVAFYVIAAGCAVREILYGRSSQGSIAWLLSLFFFPYVTVFLYLAFGWRRFDDYVRLRRGPSTSDAQARITGFDTDLRFGHADEKATAEWPLLANLSPLPFLEGNRVDILVNGEQTYASLFDGIRAARNYILVQYYTLRDDRIGRELADLLIEKAHDGVKVFVLYDDIGSSGLGRRYLRRLETEGVRVCGFNRRRPMFPLFRPFRINFRNHRKNVIVDGRVAWVGGLNLGDEHLGRDPDIPHWRDTHARVEGPAAISAQIAFAEDWHWATGSAPEVEWPQPQSNEDGVPVLVMPSGPADAVDTCPIAFTEVLSRARERLWVVSPYFVPGEDIQTALTAAVLRGVDVRLLVPQNPDHPIVGLASACFAEALAIHGVKVHLYQKGFLHQKVVLVDDDLASLGTVNFDNRSFHINFEITLWFTDKATISFLDRMVRADLEESWLATPEHYATQSFWRRLAVRFARLFAPLL